MINKEELIVRKARMEDAVPAMLLLAKLGLIMPDEAHTQAHWNRLWPENPYYKIFNDEIHYGWVMEYQGKMVGFFGCFPRLYFLDRKPFRFAIPSQWGVEKEFRSYTGLLCDKFFYEDPIKTRLTTTAIKPTGKLFEKYKGNPVPSPDLTSVYMVPLKIEKLIIQKLSSKIKQQALLKIITPLLRLGALPWRLHYPWIKKSPFISEVNVNNLSDDFDAFWLSYLETTNGLVASRSAESLKWFYQGGFRKLENKVFIYKKNNKILGYASIVNEPVKDSTLNRYKVVDMIALSDEVKKDLMNYMIRYCYKKGADVLEIHLPGLIHKSDIPVFTLLRKIPVWPFYYHSTDPEINEKLLKPDQWHTSPYDGDACLF